MQAANPTCSPPRRSRRRQVPPSIPSMQAAPVDAAQRRLGARYRTGTSQRTPRVRVSKPDFVPSSQCSQPRTLHYSAKLLGYRCPRRVECKSRMPRVPCSRVIRATSNGVCRQLSCALPQPAVFATRAPRMRILRKFCAQLGSVSRPKQWRMSRCEREKFSNISPTQLDKESAPV